MPVVGQDRGRRLPVSPELVGGMVDGVPVKMARTAPAPDRTALPAEGRVVAGHHVEVFA